MIAPNRASRSTFNMLKSTKTLDLTINRVSDINLTSQDILQSRRVCYANTSLAHKMNKNHLVSSHVAAQVYTFQVERDHRATSERISAYKRRQLSTVQIFITLYEVEAYVDKKRMSESEDFSPLQHDKDERGFLHAEIMSRNVDHYTQGSWKTPGSMFTGSEKLHARYLL